MNGDTLARHYGVLTPWERVPLMAAAAARGDRAEAERLARAAPTNLFRVPDYRGLSEALERLAYHALLARLELVALYREVTGRLEDVPPRRRRRGGDRETDGRLWAVARWFAHLAVVYAGAWRLLCAGLKVDPEALLRDLPGYDAVRRFEPTARASAFTAEQALAYLRGLAEGRAGPGPAGPERVWRLDGAEEVARAWRACLDEWAGWWA